MSSTAIPSLEGVLGRQLSAVGTHQHRKGRIITRWCLRTCSGHLDPFVPRHADRTADSNRCAPFLFPISVFCGGTQIGALLVIASPLMCPPHLPCP